MMRLGIMGVIALSMGSCCTEIGCANSVSIQLGAAAGEFVADVPVLVRACAGSDCVEETITPRAGAVEGGDRVSLLGSTLLYRPAGGLREGSLLVSLELSRQGQVVLNQTRETVVGPPSRPNGPFCPPTCWGASVTL